jgi:branched-chain amino acid transport system permease protein|tara:strand:- start:219 stop:1112 length:894 start_codon:yes stop_codon:yes gene_type:complete
VDGTLLFQLFVNGLSIGAIYILLVFGLQLIIRTTGIVNFAHGEMYVFGAYTFWFTYSVLDLHLGFAVILTVIVMAIISGVVYRAVFHYVQARFKADTPLSDKALMSAMASIGLMMVLSRIIVLYFGTDQKGIPSFLPQVFVFSGIRLPAERLSIILIAVLIAGILSFFFFGTKLGKAMRAVSTDSLASKLMGINSDRIFIASFALGSILAGVAGLLIAPVFALDPAMGTEIIFMAMLVMVFGGINSYKGAVYAGITVGLAESFGYYFIGIISHVLLFVMVMVFLIFRPGGFFGEALE